MKVAVVGSRNLTIGNLGDYLPQTTTEIVSGGAKGIDLCGKQYAMDNGLKYMAIPFIQTHNKTKV